VIDPAKPVRDVVHELRKARSVRPNDRREEGVWPRGMTDHDVVLAVLEHSSESLSRSENAAARSEACGSEQVDGRTEVAEIPSYLAIETQRKIRRDPRCVHATLGKRPQKPLDAAEQVAAVNVKYPGLGGQRRRKFLR